MLGSIQPRCKEVSNLRLHLLLFAWAEPVHSLVGRLCPFYEGDGV